MAVAGELVIKTKTDNSNFTKGIKEMEKDIETYRKGLEKLENQRKKLFESKVDVDDSLKQYYELIDSIMEESDKFEKIYKSAGDTEGLERVSRARESYIAKYDEEYKEQLQKLYEIENALSKNEKEQEKFKQQIIQTSDVLEKQKGIQLMQQQMEESNKSLSKIIKKVIRWAGYIIGIRSAYAGVRKIISIVGKENEKVAGQFRTLGNALSNALATLFTPIAEKLVKLFANIMMYVNYIYYRLTGKNLFNFAKAFEDANKSSSGIAKNMSKITTGFDEMNVVQDNSSGASGGTQSFDNPFEGWENFQPPGWLKTIGDIIKGLANIVQKYWKGIVVALIVGGIALMVTKFIKFIKGIKDIKSVSDGLKGVSVNFTGFFDALGKGIEAIAILGGFALVIQAITDMITAFAQSGLSVNEILGLMATIVGSLITLITTLTVATQFIQTPTAMGGLLVLTGSIVSLLLIMKATLPTILEAVGTFIQDVGPTLNTVLETIGQNIEDIIYALGTVLPPIIEKIGDVFDKVFNGIDGIIKTVGDTIVKIMTISRDVITKVLDKILEFINKLGPAVNNLVDNIILAVTKVINFIVSGVEYLINTVVVDGLNSIIRIVTGGALGELFADWFGFEMPRISHIEIARFVPRLAKGGIVNNPGRGVMMGSYIAGEKGPEAVIPLDDDTLDRLGLAFARHTQINTTVPVYVGNRQIAREIRRINAEDNFAFNV